MSEPTRLSKRVAELLGCSRADAESYIEGGWVSVDGQVVEQPQRMVTTERVELDPAATLEAPQPATVLLHKPAGWDAIEGRKPAAALVTPDTRWADDPTGVRLLQRHFIRLTPLVPLDVDASGLMVLTQDGRVWRRLTEDADQIEQEFVVEVVRRHRALRAAPPQPWPALPRPRTAAVQGELAERDPPALRDQGVQPGQLRDMCAQVGLQVVAIRRIRIGKVPLGKMPVGEWRYLPAGEKF